MHQHRSHVYSDAGEYDAEKDVKTRKNRQSTFALQYKDEAAVIPTEASKEFQNVRDKQAFIRQFCAHYYSKHSTLALDA